MPFLLHTLLGSARAAAAHTARARSLRALALSFCRAALAYTLCRARASIFCLLPLLHTPFCSWFAMLRTAAHARSAAMTRAPRISLRCAFAGVSRAGARFSCCVCDLLLRISFCRAHAPSARGAFVARCAFLRTRARAAPHAFSALLHICCCAHAVCYNGLLPTRA